MRISDDGPPGYFRARYGPEGPELPVRDGSLERWLAEHYCLYALDLAGEPMLHFSPRQDVVIWPLRPLSPP